MRREVKMMTRAEALDLAKRQPGIGGICAQCGCTEGDACIESHDVGITWRLCHWANVEHTLCDSAACLSRAANAEALARRTLTAAAREKLDTWRDAWTKTGKRQ
jgi:hypothetical protein